MDTIIAICISIPIICGVLFCVLCLRSPHGCETPEHGFRYCAGCDKVACPGTNYQAERTPARAGKWAKA